MSLDPMSVLPRQIGLTVLSYLNIQNLGTCCKVSKSWNLLASDNALWGIVSKGIFSETIQADNIKNFLKTYHDQCLVSSDELIDRAEAFVNKLSVDQNSRFRCILGNGTNYRTLSIEILNLNKPPNTYDFQYDCFASDTVLKELLVKLTKVSDFFVFKSGNHEQTPIQEGVRGSKNLEIHRHMIKTPVRGPLQGILRFPVLYGEPLECSTEIEEKIVNIVKQKLENLAKQSSVEKTPICAISGATVLTGFLFNKFRK